MKRNVLAYGFLSAALFTSAAWAFLSGSPAGTHHRLDFSLLSEQNNGKSSVHVIFSSVRKLPEITSIVLVPPSVSAPVKLTAGDFTSVPGFKNRYRSRGTPGLPMGPGKYELALKYRNGEVQRESIYWQYRSIVLPERLDFRNGYILWKNDESVVSYSLQFYDYRGRPVYRQMYCPVRESDECVLFLDQRRFKEGQKYFVRLRGFDTMLTQSREKSEYYLAANSALSGEYSFTFTGGEADIFSWRIKPVTSCDFLEGTKKTMFFDAAINNPGSVRSVFIKDARGRRWEAAFNTMLSVFRVQLMQALSPGEYTLTIRDASLRVQEERVFIGARHDILPAQGIRYDGQEQRVVWQPVSGASEYRVDVYRENSRGLLFLAARRSTLSSRMELDGVGAAGERLCAEIWAFNRTAAGKGNIVAVAQSKRIYFTK
ncbi:MAG: hypothetical protein WC695_00830 [Candidatus Omnitrophota bacterium]